MSFQLLEVKEDTYQIINVCLIGCTEVGKTQLANALSGDKFTDSWVSTIGVDLLVYYDENNKIKVNIWDLAGNERFQFVIKSYIQKSQIMCFLYVWNDIKSYNKMVELYEMYKGNNMITNKIVVIISTKNDENKRCKLNLLSNGVRPTNPLDLLTEQMSRDLSCKFFETSSKKLEGIKELIGYFVSNVAFGNQRLGQQAGKRKLSSEIEIFNVEQDIKSKGFDGQTSSDILLKDIELNEEKQPESICEKCSII